MDTTQSRSRPWRRVVLPALMLCAAAALAQEQQERAGILLHWGLVPASAVAEHKALEDFHGGHPPGGGKVRHLVLALFDAKTGARIDNAVVRAQVLEPGIATNARYVPPMPMNGLASYGQLFGMVYDGPYHFKVWAHVPQHPDVEFDIVAAAQLDSHRR